MEASSGRGTHRLNSTQTLTEQWQGSTTLKTQMPGFGSDALAHERISRPPGSWNE